MVPISHRETPRMGGAVPDTPTVLGVEVVVVIPRVVIRTDARVPIKTRGMSGPRTMVRRPLLRPEAEAAAQEYGPRSATERQRTWLYQTRHYSHSLKNERPTHPMAK